MKNIIIVGTGAVAAEITSYLVDTDFAESQNLKIKGYIEYAYNKTKYYEAYGLTLPILGDIDSYKIEDNDYFVIGISDPEFRLKQIEILREKGASFINLIHPSAIIASTAKIGTGNIINPQCIIGPKAVLGDFNLLTSQSMISHDCKVGNNNILSTALLCGHVTVGDNNRFGIRSTVIPHIHIGNKTLIQAGMVVDKNVPDEATIFHRFKEKIIAIPQ